MEPPRLRMLVLRRTGFLLLVEPLLRPMSAARPLGVVTAHAASLGDATAGVDAPGLLGRTSAVAVALGR